MKETRKTTIVKIIPMALCVLYTILLAVCVVLLEMPINKAVIAFMTVCSTMLLTDLSKTIKDTYNMDAGDFKKIYTPYYVCCFLCSMALIGTILIVQKQDLYADEISNLLASIGIVIAEYIGALLGNKLATGVAENKDCSVGNDQEEGK